MEILKHDLHPPGFVCVLAARCLARETRFEESLKILDKGKEAALEREDHNEDYGELACASGQILRQMHRYPQALTEYLLARECFQELKDGMRLAMAESGMGNVHFCQGNAAGARMHYMAALSALRNTGQKHAEASVLGNLGLVEYDSGRMRRALLFLGRAINLHRMLKNQWNEAVLGLAQAKVLLATGYFTKAMRSLQQVNHLKRDLHHEGGVWETSGLLAWICELLGKSAAARGWWSLLPETEVLAREPRLLFIISCLRGMTSLFQGKFQEAMEFYREVLARARAKDASDLECADALHGLGFCQTLLGHQDAPDNLRRAVTGLSPNPGRIALMQVQIAGNLFFPRHFPKSTWQRP